MNFLWYTLFLSAYSVMEVLTQRIPVNITSNGDGRILLESNSYVLPRALQLLNNRSALWFSNSKCPMALYDYTFDSVDFEAIKVLIVGYNKLFNEEKSYAVANVSTSDLVYFIEYPTNFTNDKDTPAVMWIYQRPAFRRMSGRLTKPEVLECLNRFRIAHFAEIQVGLTMYGQPKRNPDRYESMEAYTRWVKKKSTKAPSSLKSTIAMDKTESLETLITANRPLPPLLAKNAHNNAVIITANAEQPTPSSKTIEVKIFNETIPITYNDGEIKYWHIILISIVLLLMLIVAAIVKYKELRERQSQPPKPVNISRPYEHTSDIIHQNIRFSSPIDAKSIEILEKGFKDPEYVPMITKSPLPKIPMDEKKEYTPGFAADRSSQNIIYENLRPITVIQKDGKPETIIDRDTSTILL